jgi:ATP-dependent DNA ligase
MEWSTSRRPALLPVGFVEPCLPSSRATTPEGCEWVHEIKHDGYRVIVRRDSKRVRVFTRRGFDWTGRFPWTEDALRSLRVQSATIDGEAVWLQRGKRACFIVVHHPAVAGDVGCENGSQPAFDPRSGHENSPWNPV